MNKIIDTIWNPDKKIEKGFKYATYLLLAPILLLSFILPISMILVIYITFFVLRTVVSFRAAKIHDIDQEKVEIYSVKKSMTRPIYLIFTVLLAFYISLIIFFYVKTYIPHPNSVSLEQFKNQLIQAYKSL